MINELLPVVAGLAFAGIAGMMVFRGILGYFYDKKTKAEYVAHLRFCQIIVTVLAFLVAIFVPILIFDSLNRIGYQLAILSIALPVSASIIYAILAILVSKKESYTAEPAISPGGSLYFWYSIKWKQKKAGWLISLSHWLLALIALVIGYTLI